MAAPSPEARSLSRTLPGFAIFKESHKGQWSYEVTGESPQIPVTPIGPDIPVELGVDSVQDGRGIFRISGEENVVSQSGSPLVIATAPTKGTQALPFDLYRVGRFMASVRSRVGGLTGTEWRGSLRLKDPDGTIVANSDSSRLTFDVTLPMLNKSRTNEGSVRQWTLEVITLSAGAGDNRITASVTAAARVATSLIQSRIDELLGPGGSNVFIFGENRDGRALARLKIRNEFTAETLDIYGLLDKVVKTGEDDPDIEPDVIYTIGETAGDLKHGLRLDVNSLKVKSISVNLGSGQQIQPPAPALRIRIVTEGALKVRIKGFTLATVSLRDNSVTLWAAPVFETTGNLDTCRSQDFPGRVVLTVAE